MIGRSVSDIEFFEAKVKILAEQNTILSGQIVQLRRMLRQAEEFRIKYEILIRNSQIENQKLKMHQEKMKITLKQQFQATILAQSEENWNRKMIELEQKLKKEASLTIENLRLELSEAKQIINQFQSKKEEMQLYGFKMKRYEKQNQLLQERLQELKKFYLNKQQEEISSLKAYYNSTYKEKLANERNNYEGKINILQKKLIELQIQKDNNQFKIPNIQIGSIAQLKTKVEEKGKIYEEQVQELRELLFSKNQQINGLLTGKLRIQQSHRSEITQRNQFIQELQNRLMLKQRQFSNELFNAIQRNNAVKESQLAELKDQIQILKQQLERQNAIWHQKLINQENQIQNINKIHEEERKRLNQEKNQQRKNISDLSVKLKEAEGEREFGDTQMLINSLKDIDAKDEGIGGYENGIVFLERQLKKCQLKLMERSKTVDKLYKEINDLRIQGDKELNETKQKSKKQKKDLYDRLMNLQNENKALHDRLRLKDREDRRRARETFKEKTELQQKLTAQNDLIEELQRDYSRVLEGKKGLESSYREERQKNISGVSQTTSLKRQKFIELQRQKNQLQVIFRDKFQQQKLKFQDKLDALNHTIDQLKQDLQVTKKQNQLLHEENKKILSQIEMNKENNRLAEYNKKIASLNLQLALTQNIYETLRKVKVKKLGQSESMDWSMGDIRHQSFEEQRQPLMMSFLPASNAGGNK